MNTIFKVGDTAEFTERYMEHKVGDRFTVTAVEPSVTGTNIQLVQGRKPNNHSGVYSGRLKLVQPAEHTYKVGDKVEVLESSAWHKVGPGEVTDVDRDILRVKQPHNDNGVGWWVMPKHIRPLGEEPAPKTEKKKATLVDGKNTPQIGDTIVAFWEQGPIEFRKKGVVTFIDSEGDYLAGEDYCINWDSELNPRNAPHVYIVERAPKPEPVKVDPNQKWIDAPIGSIAKHTSRDFVWRKTANNEWSLLSSSGNVIRDRNDSTVGARAVLFTP